MTRRELLAALPPTLALVLLESCCCEPAGLEELWAEDQGRTTTEDGPLEQTIVIGAGVAGLAAARALKRGGRRVVVLEARDRLGGRTWTHEVAGVPMDVGASWIHGPTSANPLVKLANDAGVKLVEDDGDASIIDYKAGDMGDETLGELEALLTSFTGALPSLRRKLGKRASVREALERYIDGEGYKGRERAQALFMAEHVIALDTGAPTRKLGLRYYDEDEAFGDGDALPIGGFSKLVDHLADGLDVRLEHAVEAIRYDDQGVVVHTTKGRIKGANVVVTLPLGVLKAGGVRFEPALPSRKREAIARLGVGSVEKILLRWEKAPWPRGTGDLYYIPKGEDDGLCAFINVTPYVKAPALIAFARGDAASSLTTMPRVTLGGRVAERLSVILGEKVPPPSAIYASSWTKDPYTLGCYSYVPVGASRKDMDALARPVGGGRVGFAGEATLFDYTGTVHGAYLSGVREARRLLGG